MLISDQGLNLVRVTMVFGFLGMVAMQVWAEDKQDVMREKELTARIQELQRERINIESELRRLRSQPEGTSRSTVPRSEVSDQPTRSLIESLESVPGLSMRQRSSGGRDVQFSIRESK
jgi:hypothetical protein